MEESELTPGPPAPSATVERPYETIEESELTPGPPAPAATVERP